MSEQRFVKYVNDTVKDTRTNKMYPYMGNIVNLLNEQQATIDKLDQENADSLGARIKAQEEWEKCTDKLKAKILEQQTTIKHLEEEMGELENDLLTARREKMDNYYPIPKNCDSCVFLKNNGICGYCTFTLKCYDSEDDLTEYGSLPSCPFKHHQEYKTMMMNWDSLVEKASEISVRNIELDELIGRLRKELDDCEKFRYAIFKRLGELTDEL